MKISHQKAHRSEGLQHSTGRSVGAPRLKHAAKKVANYIVVLLR